jgi:hypothetical protein
MSKVKVLDLNNYSVGQFDAIVPSLAWSLNGHPNVSGGGSFALKIPDEVAAQSWINFGRMVVIEPDDLPAYIGIIDTPWSAVSPVTMTIYDPEYLFAIRVAENAPVKISGTVGKLIGDYVNGLNSQENMFVRMGNIGDVDASNREETVDTRMLWEQLKALLSRSATELVFRAGQGADGQWYVYIDIARAIGIDTDYLLSEGTNMKVNGAIVRGEIYNRIIGISSQSTAASRLQTEVLENTESKNVYRMRNRFVQFRDVTMRSTLDAYTSNSLSASRKPYLELAVSVENIDHSFLRMRPGNLVMVHSTNIILPGGKRGWRGKARITKMVFAESTNTVNMTLIGDL